MTCDAIIDYLKNFDMIILIETFVEEKDCDKISEDMPKTHTWTWLPAERVSTKGRAIAGMTIGHRNGMKTRNLTLHHKEWVICMDFAIDDKWMTLVGIYNRKGINKGTRQIIQDRIDRNPTKTIIAGDLNARIGENAGRNGAQRTTKDRTTDAEGAKWVKMMTKYDMTIMNGNLEGDWTGEFTHHSYRAMSVIDYAAISRLSEDTVKLFKIGDRTESDHFPMEITLKAERDKQEEVEVTKWRQSWTKVKKRDYPKKIKTDDDELCNWDDIKQAIWEANPLEEVRPRQKKRLWFDRECYDLRKRAEQALKDFRTDPGKENEWRQARRTYKDKIKDCRDRENQLLRERLEQVRTINDAWNYIKSDRPSKRKQTCKLDMSILGQHFKQAMEGVDDRSKEPKENHNFTELVTAEEVRTAVHMMKEGKAAGPDKMKAEAFVHGGAGLHAALARMFTKYLNGDPIPDDWREGVINPIYKSGPKDDPNNYRGITLVNAVYKLYSLVLLRRLTKELEDGGALPDNQAAYRKGRSTIDNIYIVDKIVRSRLERGVKTFAVFLDLKAAFDNVDRKFLFRKLKKAASEYLVAAIEDIYEETPNMIGDMRFMTTKGLRQGCPLSPTLFSLYTADMEDCLRRAQAGGVTIGRQRIHLLAYADDVVIVAEDAAQLKEVFRILKSYFAKHAMTMNINKTKVMTFSRGGRLSREQWLWNKTTKEEFEEVRRFKYLGFTFSNNGQHDGHIDDIVVTGNSRLMETWSIGERRFPNNFVVRMKMFDALVLPVLTYGCEVFGRDEYDEIEVLHRKYIKMTLGLRDSTKTTMIMQETRRKPLIFLTQARAARFEKTAEGSDRETLKTCIKWNNGRTKQTRNDKQYEKEVKKDIEGRPYEKLMGKWENLPRYLTTGREYKVIARGRLENMERGLSKWGDRRCRLCGTDDETLDHMLEVCNPDDNNRTREEILDESGEGRDYLTKLDTVLKEINI